MTTLTGPERPAASGTADSVVVFLHGYGADGNDLIGLAEPLAPHLPNTRFLAPNAPERCPANPAGYQWFPIPWLDGIARGGGPGRGGALLRASRPLARRSRGGRACRPERTVLVGFSQGTMMALHVGLRRAAPLAGIVGFSGRLLEPERLAAETRRRAAGAARPRRRRSRRPLREPRRGGRGAGRRRASRPTPTSRAGSAHGIAPDGLGLALGFIRERLGIAGDAALRRHRTL